jgi:hypothetical protein
MLRKYTLEGMLAPLRRGICMADDGGAGGGGGDDDKPMSRKEVTDLLNKTVTGAMKSWGERVTKDWDGKLTALGDTIVQKLAPGGTPAGGEPGKGAGGAGGPQDSELAKELAREREARVEQDKRLKALETSKQKAEQDLKDQTMRGGLRDALTKAGVRPALMQAALALHREGGKLVVKDGQVLVKVQRTGYEDEIAIDEAIGEWVKTDEGKQFLPAADVGGTGDGSTPRPGAHRSGPGTGLTSKDPAERTATAVNILSQPI